MSFQNFYKRSFGTLFIILIGLTAIGFAQKPQPRPTPTVLLNQNNRELPVAGSNNLYCAGYIESGSVNTGYEVVGADNEKDQHIYAQGDFLYISAGANRGVKVGDKFSVIRPRGKVSKQWTRKTSLGFYVQEVGMVEIVRVKNEVSVARVKTSCDNLLLGDLLQPVPPRTSPLFEKRPALDLFGEPSGKASGRIVMARDNQELLSTEQIVYVDLGAEDNVKVGDHLTVFRSLGTGNIFDKVEKEELLNTEGGYQSEEYKGGKFSSQTGRKKGEQATGAVVTTEDAKSRRPNYLRRVVGELVILNVKERTATAVITRNTSEIHTGDMVEIQ